MTTLIRFVAASCCAPSLIGAAATKAEQQFESARHNPPALYAFLLRMPKGADLHNHLAGAVYAETYLSEAAADGLCIDTKTSSIGRAPCIDSSLPAAAAISKADVYSRAIDSLSMRDFVAVPQ